MSTTYLQKSERLPERTGPCSASVTRSPEPSLQAAMFDNPSAVAQKCYLLHQVPAEVEFFTEKVPDEQEHSASGESVHKHWRRDRPRVRESECWSDGHTRQIPDDVRSEDPSLWIVMRQEFDRAEPVRLILPVWLEIIFAVHSQERQTSNSGSLRQNSRYKNGTTKRCALAFLAVPYRALQSDRCLVITT